MIDLNVITGMEHQEIYMQSHDRTIYEYVNVHIHIRYKRLDLVYLMHLRCIPLMMHLMMNYYNFRRHSHMQYHQFDDLTHDIALLKVYSLLFALLHKNYQKKHKVMMHWTKFNVQL